MASWIATCHLFIYRQLYVICNVSPTLLFEMCNSFIIYSHTELFLHYILSHRTIECTKILHNVTQRAFYKQLGKPELTINWVSCFKF
jgi:uncharacterized protein (DUF1810 family)